MKNILKNSIFVLLLLSFMGVQAQKTKTVDTSQHEIINGDRNVIWVHGLGGTQSSWQHYDEILEAERKVNTVRGTHQTDNGLGNAATSAKSWIDIALPGNAATRSTNLGIGHSMGGLIIREIDRTTTAGNKRFGGFITVATPNKGAYIANSVNNGNANNFLSHACNQLLAGPSATNWVNSLFGGLTPEDFCDITDSALLDDFISGTTASSIAEDSADINTLSSFNHSLPRITLWGEENSPVHWRLVSTMIEEDPNLTENPTINAILATISQPNDTWFITVAGVAKAVYSVMRAYHIGLGNICSIPPMSWFNYCDNQAAQHYYKASQWNKGKIWFNQSEGLYTAIMGGTQTTSTTYTTYEWVTCDDDFPPFESPYQSNEQPQNNKVSVKRINPFDNNSTTTYSVDPCEDEEEGYWEEVTYTVTTTINYPNDGVVPKYATMLEGISSQNEFKISGANHFEIRDMSLSPQGDLTKQAFDNIFNRPSDNFFSTSERN